MTDKVYIVRDATNRILGSSLYDSDGAFSHANGLLRVGHKEVFIYNTETESTLARVTLEPKVEWLPCEADE